MWESTLCLTVHKSEEKSLRVSCVCKGTFVDRSEALRLRFSVSFSALTVMVVAVLKVGTLDPLSQALA